MCIEIYSRDHAIQIPFAQELIRFHSATSFDGEYTMLVRNSSGAPISQLLALYPRPLLKTTGDIPQLTNVSNIASSLIDRGAPPKNPDEFRSCEWKDDKLTMWIPNPNSPDRFIPDLSGRLTRNDFKFGVPRGFDNVHVQLLNNLNDGFSAWTLNLTRPLGQNEALWISLIIRVQKAGRRLPSGIFAPSVFHTLASPQSVRTTLYESFQARESTAFGKGADPAFMKFYESFLDAFGLRDPERKVNVGYYELSVSPGPPTKRELLNWNHEGHLWMRSTSPKVVMKKIKYPGEHQTESSYEPVFEWKSGTMLDQFCEAVPDPSLAFPSMDFRLRFTIRGSM